MAEPFTAKMLILAAIFGAWLPSVTPYDYNTCKGGLDPQTCQNPFSSHCCMSGTYLSATCCRNSCKHRTWGHYETRICGHITDSMCCSTTFFGSGSCCNYASYSRTSLSSVKGYYDTCTGGRTIERCTNRLSRSCCSSGVFDSASCCRESFTCGNYEPPETCYGPSVFCCPSSQRCCDYSSYEKELDERERQDNVMVAGMLIGGFILIVAPVFVVCYRMRRARASRLAHISAAAFAAAASNLAEVEAASPQPGSENPPPPNEHHEPPTPGTHQPPPYQRLFPPQPQSGPTAVVPSNGSQPLPYEHHQPPTPGIHQPPPNQSPQQFQAPLAPQPHAQSGSKFEMTLDRTSGK